MNANSSALATIACLIIWLGLASFFAGIISRRSWWARMLLITLGLAAFAAGSALYESLPLP